MKIHWVRIVIAGFVAEVLLLVIFRIVSRPLASLPGGATVLGGGFILMVLAALWVAHKSESLFVLQGILVGISAVVFYTIGDILRGNLHLAGHSIFFYIAHITKLLGGAVGGFLAAKRAKAEGPIAQKAANGAM
jgi:hypothetical protein